MNDSAHAATPELRYGPNDKGEVQFEIDSFETFSQACTIAERDNIRKGRIVIDAARYVFLPFYRLKSRPLLMRIMLGRTPDGIKVPPLATHFTGMLVSLLKGRRLPENICAELLENHLESPLRSWCEKLIMYKRIVKLEGTMIQVLQKTNEALRKRKGIAYLLSAPLLWPRWALNKLNLIALKFQIDLSIFLVGFFVARRRNVAEIAWEIDEGRLVFETANNAKIPRYLANVAAERAELARRSILEPGTLGPVQVDIQQENKPLSSHHLSGSGLGVFMVSSIALRFGGELTPPRYDPQRRKTVAVFTAALDKLPAAK